MSRESISVVVPVYNSKGTIQPLVERLISVLSPLVKGYEIILVNDGGSCFWQAEFDVDSLDVVTFNVNGEA